VRAWLREAGLVNILVDCTGESCCAESQSTSISDAAGRTAKISIFVATGSRRVIGAREQVQSHYGELATSGKSCCSSEAAAVDVMAAYTPEELTQVPSEAASFSLGCGNPVAMASLRPGQVVLDIGSGGGIDAFYAARRVGPTGKVIGLDMTPTMIERARQAAAEAGLSQVEFRLGQAEAMPIDEGSVDVILSNCVINLCEDKGKVFEEAFRVMKDGGRLMISDMVTGGPLPMRVRGNAEQWGGCVNGALPEREYLDLAAQAGFQNINTTRTDANAGGEIGGVSVFSLYVSATKGQAASSLPADVIPLTLVPSAKRTSGCCG